jgi:hypothetical protein
MTIKIIVEIIGEPFLPTVATLCFLDFSKTRPLFQHRSSTQTSYQKSARSGSLARPLSVNAESSATSLAQTAPVWSAIRSRMEISCCLSMGSRNFPFFIPWKKWQAK